MAALAERLRDYRYEGLEQVLGEALWGGEHMEFYPDEEALRNLVLRLFFEPEP